MKKIIISLLAVMGVVVLPGCSDMLESDSSRQLFDKELDSKTDSVHFAFGIMQAMQQLADQYVFIGEMRGDLVKTTEYTDNNLRKLADFSADTSCKYDSAYLYYRVINNCNYYIAHRDTTLLTGSIAVAMREYAAVKAFRAWAYLQLARTYGKVPFFTDPLTTISQINGSNYPELDLNGIVSRLAPDLEQYTGYTVPNYDDPDIGKTNWGQSKKMFTRYCFIPVDIILGEMYLEAGQFDKAASHYTTYLTRVANDNNRYALPFFTFNGDHITYVPSDMDTFISGIDWTSVFDNNSTSDYISYIPMSVNRLRGTTTSVPLAFGYNYYATSNKKEELRQDEIQIMPSDTYWALSDSCDYYYYRNVTGGMRQQYAGSVKWGDMRARSIVEQGTKADSTKQWVKKYDSGNIYLYRTSTIYLHLAEALNRLGYVDAAFAILKDGITVALLDETVAYITPETRELLQTACPFLSDENRANFPAPTNDVSNTNFGIHHHGCGVTGDGNYPGRSPYQLDTIVGVKMKQIAEMYNVTVGTTKADSINAMEDLLCDEYALELAFEGTRWYDLMRLARHKNSAALYGADFGGRWLARKLQYKNPVKDLTIPENWYLPFK